MIKDIIGVRASKKEGYVIVYTRNLNKLKGIKDFICITKFVNVKKVKKILSTLVEMDLTNDQQIFKVGDCYEIDGADPHITILSNAELDISEFVSDKEFDDFNIIVLSDNNNRICWDIGYDISHYLYVPYNLKESLFKDNIDARNRVVCDHLAGDNINYNITNLVHGNDQYSLSYTSGLIVSYNLPELVYIINKDYLPGMQKVIKKIVNLFKDKTAWPELIGVEFEELSRPIIIRILDSSNIRNFESIVDLDAISRLSDFRFVVIGDGSGLFPWDIGYNTQGDLQPLYQLRLFSLGDLIN